MRNLIVILFLIFNFTSLFSNQIDTNIAKRLNIIEDKLKNYQIENDSLRKNNIDLLIKLEKYRIEKDYWDDAFTNQGTLYIGVITIIAGLAVLISFFGIRREIKKNKEYIEIEIKKIKKDKIESDILIHNSLFLIYHTYGFLMYSQDDYGEVIRCLLISIKNKYKEEVKIYEKDNITLKEKNYNDTINSINTVIEIIEKIKNIDKFSDKGKKSIIELKDYINEYIYELLEIINKRIKQRIIILYDLIKKIYEIIDKKD